MVALWNCLKVKFELGEKWEQCFMAAARWNGTEGGCCRRRVLKWTLSNAACCLSLINELTLLWNPLELLLKWAQYLLANRLVSLNIKTHCLFTRRAFWVLSHFPSRSAQYWIRLHHTAFEWLGNGGSHWSHQCLICSTHTANAIKGTAFCSPLSLSKFSHGWIIVSTLKVAPSLSRAFPFSLAPFSDLIYRTADIYDWLFLWLTSLWLCYSICLFFS